MSVPWAIAKAIFKVVAPNIPEIVSTISKLKNQPGGTVNNEPEDDPLLEKVGELEKTATAQLQLIEQLAVQIQALQKMVPLAIGLAAGAGVLALISIMLFLFRS